MEFDELNSLKDEELDCIIRQVLSTDELFIPVEEKNIPVIGIMKQNNPPKKSEQVIGH